MPRIFSEEDREIIKCRMLDAGIRLLEHKRYKNISVEEVALEVGVAKGTFYNFFLSKEQFFYELMQLIKERNRECLCALPDKAGVHAVAECLFQRYMSTKTVYDYFTPEEIKQIIRRLPEGDTENDSAEFAEELCGRIKGAKADPATVVAMCNMLGIAAANRSLMEPEGYEKALRVFTQALAGYIVGGE